MRHNNKNIIIHGLIERSCNKKKMNSAKFDFCEEMMIEFTKKIRLEIQHIKEIDREKEGRFVDVTHDNVKYKIFVHKDESILDRQKRFIDKLKAAKY